MENKPVRKIQINSNAKDSFDMQEEIYSYSSIVKRGPRDHIEELFIRIVDEIKPSRCKINNYGRYLGIWIYLDNFNIIEILKPKRMMLYWSDDYLIGVNCWRPCNHFDYSIALENNHIIFKDYTDYDKEVEIEGKDNVIAILKDFLNSDELNTIMFYQKFK